METVNILIVGVGGQGTLLASRVLGNLALSMGYDVKLSEVHGMAQRGGSVVTYVRFGEKVHSPLVEPGTADIILAFEKLEALRWMHYLKKDGTIIINDQEINPMPVIMGAVQYPNDIEKTIRDQCPDSIFINALDMANDIGNIKVVNIVLLGVLAKKLNIEKSLWLSAIEQTVPPRFVEINKEAFIKGYSQEYQF